MLTSHGAQDLLSATNIGHLKILHQMLNLESITATANANNLPQSSASRILGKMRRAFEDPLLVRNGDRMVVTERGSEIRHVLTRIIEQIDVVAAGGSEFQPTHISRQFKFAVADSVMISLVPKIISGVTKAGPGLVATIRSVEPEFDVASALADGELDLVIDAVSTFGEREDIGQLKSSVLYDDDVVLMVREGHPVASAKSLCTEQYLELQHLAPHSYYRPNLGPIDGPLSKMKQKRRIHAFVPEFSLVPAVLMETDFVFTTSRRFAEHFARTMRICIVPAPSIFEPFRFRMLWHERTHHSPASIWLREIVRKSADRRQSMDL
ncbi:LysR family transcriptional regulator [Hoeflea sp.]|uniref:LysR family transcriptional regulator n=1 Tax=Hoeflea sp. TaxID=1940281 RepID=UPI003B01C3D6